MKKVIFIVIGVIVSLSASAQRASEMDVTWHNADDFAYSHFFAEVSAGYHFGGELYDNGFGFGANLGYRYKLLDNLCWDVVKVGANTSHAEIGGYMDIRFLTGVRYFFGEFPNNGNPFYLSAGVGGQIAVDEWYGTGSGFAYEAGLGVCLSRHVSIGFVYEGSVGKTRAYYHYDDYYDEYNSNWGIIGVKLGFQF